MAVGRAGRRASFVDEGLDLSVGEHRAARSPGGDGSPDLAQSDDGRAHAVEVASVHRNDARHRSIVAGDDGKSSPRDTRSSSFPKRVFASRAVTLAVKRRSPGND